MTCFPPARRGTVILTRCQRWRQPAPVTECYLFSWPSFAAVGQAGLAGIIKRKLKKIQYQPT